MQHAFTTVMPQSAVLAGGARPWVPSRWVGTDSFATCCIGDSLLLQRGLYVSAA